MKKDNLVIFKEIDTSAYSEMIVVKAGCWGPDPDDPYNAC